MGGVFLQKSGPFLNAGCIMYSISILFYILLIWGFVRTRRTPTGLELVQMRGSTATTRMLRGTQRHLSIDDCA